MFNDPKLLAAVSAGALVLAGAIGRFVWGRGRSAGIAAATKRLEQLHAEQLEAAKTPGTADDDAVKAKIQFAELALAALKEA